MFAERMSCSVQRVSVIEGGAANLTLHTLARIANVFGVTVNDLLVPPGPVGKTTKRGRPRRAER